MDQFFDQLGGRVNLPGVLISVSIGFLVFKSAQSYFRLKHIPGPTFAAFTNLVRRSWVVSGGLHEKHTKLHRKYGTVIRVGPNAVLVSQPAAVDKIYSFKTRFVKVRKALNYHFSMILTI